MASFFQNLLDFFGLTTKKGNAGRARPITPMRKQLSQSMKPIGMVTHFYDKVNVGVIKLNEGTLHVGDKIRVTHSDHYFDQVVESLQVEHKPVQEIRPGDSAGLQLNEKVREGELVFRL